MLFVNVISTPKPPTAATPSNVIRGPGLLLHASAVNVAFTLTGIGMLVLLMWGRDDAEVANEAGATGAFGDPSLHAPARRNTPSATTHVGPRWRVRKLLGRMLTSPVLV